MWVLEPYQRKGLHFLTFWDPLGKTCTFLKAEKT